MKMLIRCLRRSPVASEAASEACTPPGLAPAAESLPQRNTRTSLFLLFKSLLLTKKILHKIMSASHYLYTCLILSVVFRIFPYLLLLTLVVPLPTVLYFRCKIKTIIINNNNNNVYYYYYKNSSSSCSSSSISSSNFDNC